MLCGGAVLLGGVVELILVPALVSDLDALIAPDLSDLLAHGRRQLVAEACVELGQDLLRAQGR